MIKIRQGRKFKQGLDFDVSGAKLDVQDLAVSMTFNYADAATAEFDFSTGEITVHVARLDPPVFGVVTCTVNADADLDAGETRVISTQFQFEIVPAGIEANSMSSHFIEGSIEDDVPAEPPAAPPVEPPPAE